VRNKLGDNKLGTSPSTGKLWGNVTNGFWAKDQSTQLASTIKMSNTANTIAMLCTSLTCAHKKSVLKSLLLERKFQ